MPRTDLHLFLSRLRMACIPFSDLNAPMQAR